MSVYCFDIDGTICSKESPENYGKAKPFKQIINRINKLYVEGHTIYFFTSRHMLKEPVTKEWFARHDVRYHQIFFGKPLAQVYVDDLALNPDEFLKNEK